MRCNICGKEIQLGSGYYACDGGRFACSDACHTRLYWDDIVAEKDKHAVIGGKSYLIVPDTNTGFVGCGGREFKLKNLETGAITVTHNLWVQGEIPESHRALLPDTHEWAG